jgi:hypothetical protein
MSNDDHCIICLDPMELIYIHAGCEAKIHKNCLKAYEMHLSNTIYNIKTKYKCPACRSVINPSTTSSVINPSTTSFTKPYNKIICMITIIIIIITLALSNFGSNLQIHKFLNILGYSIQYIMILVYMALYIYIRPYDDNFYSL